MPEYVTQEECQRSHEAINREQESQNVSIVTNQKALDKLRNHVPPVWAAIITLQGMAIATLASLLVRFH